MIFFLKQCYLKRIYFFHQFQVDVLEKENVPFNQSAFFKLTLKKESTGVNTCSINNRCNFFLCQSPESFFSNLKLTKHPLFSSVLIYKLNISATKHNIS